MKAADKIKMIEERKQIFKKYERVFFRYGDGLRIGTVVDWDRESNAYSVTASGFGNILEFHERSLKKISKKLILERCDDIFAEAKKDIKKLIDFVYEDAEKKQ